MRMGNAAFAPILMTLQKSPLQGYVCACMHVYVCVYILMTSLVYCRSLYDAACGHFAPSGQRRRSSVRDRQPQHAVHRHHGEVIMHYIMEYGYAAVCIILYCVRCFVLCLDVCM